MMTLQGSKHLAILTKLNRVDVFDEHLICYCNSNVTPKYLVLYSLCVPTDDDPTWPKLAGGMFCCCFAYRTECCVAFYKHNICKCTMNEATIQDWPIYLGRFQPFIGHVNPQGEQGYSSTLFLTSALEGGEGSASRPCIHCTGGWVGLTGGLDRCGKSRPHRDMIPGPSSPQAVAIPTTLPGP